MPLLQNQSIINFNGLDITSNVVTTTLADLLAPLVVKAVSPVTSILEPAETGDTLTYTVTIQNINPLAPITNLLFTDVLPAGVTYVAGSFEVNGTPATATIVGQTLTYTIPNIAALTTVTITFEVTVD